MMPAVAPLVSLITLALSGAASVAAYPTGSDHTFAKRATIGASEIVNTSLAKLGASGSTTTISSGVTYWLAGLSPHNVYGNLDNSGNLLISQTAYTAVTPGGMSSYFQRTSSSDYTLQNRAEATIQLNDVYAASAPSYYWWLNQMANAGTLSFCGRGDTGGSTYSLKCYGSSCVNTGLIVMEQVNNNWGTAATWAVGVATLAGSTPSQVITNDGGFLMRQARVDLTHNVAGNGCWMIDDGATLFLQSGVGTYQSATSKFSPLSGQSISFVGAGVLHLDPGVYSFNSAFGPTVYGFDSGKAIEFSESIKSYSYDSSTSVLKVVFTSANTIAITLAGSYSSSSFSTGTQANKYGSYNAIFSSTSPGTSAPAVCQLTTSKCSALSLSSPSVSTSSSSSTFASSSSSTSSATATAPTSTSKASTASSSTTVTQTTLTGASTVSTTFAASTATVSAVAPTTVASTAFAAASSTSSSTVSAAPSSTLSTSSSTASIASTASSTTSSASVPATTFSYGGRDAGCYEDTGKTGAQSLGALSYRDAGMTNEMCANYCGSRNYAYAGTQYSTECYCGNTLPSTKSNACDMPYGGNSAQTCGGSWLLNVTRNNAIEVPDAGTLAPNYQINGCYADSVNRRTFSSYSFSNFSMTIGLCASTCSGKGFAYSGTEYSTECYCASWAPVTSSNACTMPCGGNKAQVCGGSDALSVVRDTSIATSGPTCGSLPSGYAVCTEGQTIKGGVCV